MTLDPRNWVFRSKTGQGQDINSERVVLGDWASRYAHKYARYDIPEAQGLRFWHRSTTLTACTALVRIKSPRRLENWSCSRRSLEMHIGSLCSQIGCIANHSLGRQATEPLGCCPPMSRVPRDTRRTSRPSYVVVIYGAIT